MTSLAITSADITARNNDVISRIKHLMTLRRLSQRALAQLLRLDPSNLSKILSGKLPVTEGLINRIVADLGVSKSWLKTGDGLPFEKRAETREIMLDAPLNPVERAGQGIPVFDIDVTAGCRSLEEIFSETRPVGLVSIPELPQDSFLVKVRGDSMAPRINNGGYVAVRQIRDPRIIFWGQIYV
ncbi:MAG: helix-turn-helix domain-containing protein, partial [Duncaniella sp.]|nr:helix-turn-helix domain-containing protein [Duncaniella sp.]